MARVPRSRHIEQEPRSHRRGDADGETVEDFVRITSPAANQLAASVTALVAEGSIRVLVRTRALLGEGWDAPALNSLVLASYVGSFMLTNQMRGRGLAGAAFVFGFSMVARSSPRMQDQEHALLLIAIASAVGIAFAARRFVRALLLLLRGLPVDGSLRQISGALLEAMTRTGSIETNPPRLRVRVRTLPDTRVAVSLEGGTFYERSRFADALAEMLQPIENPRYLITCEGSLLWRRRDYPSVATALGAKKETASSLHSVWQRRLGASELVFTRTREGCRVLLRARARAFSAALSSAAERADRWL